MNGNDSDDLDGATPLPTPTTTAVTEPLDDALADPTLPRVPGTSAPVDTPP